MKLLLAIIVIAVVLVIFNAASGTPVNPNNATASTDPNPAPAQDITAAVDSALGAAAGVATSTQNAAKGAVGSMPAPVGSTSAATTPTLVDDGKGRGH